MALSQSDTELIRIYLDGTSWMELSTVRDDQPQLVHLWFAHDEKMNIYLSSRNTRQRSTSITANPGVASGVTRPPFNGLGAIAFGLTFEATIAEVEASDLDEAFAIYQARWPYTRKIITPDKIVNNRALRECPIELRRRSSP